MSTDNPRLVTDLVDRHAGADALVIAGGPRAPAQLRELEAQGFRPAVVLSANEHGFLQQIYRPTHAVCCDDFHGSRKKRMDLVMDELGRGDAPIVSPCWFADFRIPEYVLACNTGLASIAVAMLLGCKRVVVAGIDHYRAFDPKAAVYFHAERAESNSNRKALSNFEQQIRALKGRIEQSIAVRPAGGPLLAHWPQYDPAEELPRLGPNHWRDWIRGVQTFLVETSPRGFSIGYSQVRDRVRMAMSHDEAFRFTQARKARILEPRDHPLARQQYGFR